MFLNCLCTKRGYLFILKDRIGVRFLNFKHRDFKCYLRQKMSFRIALLRTVNVSRLVSFSDIKVRPFSKCALLRCRLLGAKFIPKENSFAHGVFAKNPEKFIIAESARFDESKSDSCSGTDWMSIPIQEFCDRFYSVSNEAHKRNINMSESRYDEMCNAVKRRKDEFNEHQLSLMIKALVLWPFVKSVREPNFYNIWKTLDDRCLDHWKEWDIEKLLYFVDLWYLSRLGRQSDFCFVVVTKLATRPGRLNGHQAVQVLFYLNILRTALIGVSMYDIELKIYEHINDLSIEEIGVALMGFFKTQHLLHDQRLISELINRVQKESQTIHEITLASILKVVRYSLLPPLFDKIAPTLDLLEKEIDRLSLQSCVHISLLVTKSITFHRSSLTKVSQKLVDNISSARLKDIEKVIYPITLVSLDPLTIPCIYQTVVDELQKPEREEEIREHPKTLVALLYYLSLRNMFIEPLISKVLDEKFITETYGKNKFGISREILYLDTSVELQCPNYNGPRLPSSIRNYLSKRHSQFIPNESFKKSKHSEYFLDVVNILETLVDKNYTFKYLLPNHPRADIVVRLNKDNEVLPIPENYQNLDEFKGVIRAPEGDKWCAIVVGSRNMFAHSAAVPTGETNSKLRQLKLIGYTPIMVQSTEWPRSDTLHKIKYLKNLMFC